MPRTDAIATLYRLLDGRDMQPHPYNQVLPEPPHPAVLALDGPPQLLDIPQLPPLTVPSVTNQLFSGAHWRTARESEESEVPRYQEREDSPPPYCEIPRKDGPGSEDRRSRGWYLLKAWFGC
jgi:hypothetical protein